MPLNKLNSNRVLVLLLSILCQSAAAELKPGDVFPALAHFKLEGTAPSLLGKVVMVDFWASWCGPCKKSFPVMDALQKKYAGQGLVIIAINVDEARKDMESFLRKSPVTFTVLRDAQQKLINSVDVHTMPFSFVLDREGKVRFVHSGFHGDETRRQYEMEIETLIKP